VLEADGTLSVARTKALRRYILGLALVALTAPLDPFLRQGCNLVPDTTNPREFKLVNLDGTRPDFALSHGDAIDYARDAKKEFGIDTSERAKEFDVTLAEKASEAKPEKLSGAEVLSVDATEKRFKIKFKKKELEVSANPETKILKDKEPAAFEVVVTPGAKLNLELLQGVAITITAKK
jgi:CRISPR-associated protein Csb1